MASIRRHDQQQFRAISHTARQFAQRRRRHGAEARARAWRLRGIWYLFTLPRVVPRDQVLVHNHVRPTRHLGSRGFRAWLTAPDPRRLDVCDCAWASELGPH